MNGRSRATLHDIKPHDRIARLLVSAHSLTELSLDNARVVASFLQLRRFSAGTVFMREGNSTNADSMLLVLDGEATVEHAASRTSDGMVVTVLGAGALIGEMGLLDGGPRSATCTANTGLTVGELTLVAMEQLVEQHPQVAARLLMAISRRMSQRLRATNRKVQTFARLSRVMQKELDATHEANQRLMRVAR